MKVRQQIYDTYWRLAYERQEIFFRKIEGTYPLTNDAILQNYKFCNAYRASDRVSQYLIKNVIYSKNNFLEEDLLLRILFFRLLNKTETWDLLENKIGEIRYKNDQFLMTNVKTALEEIKKEQGVVYGNAFILCANKAFGFDKKHENHLALLKLIMKNSQKVLKSESLKKLYENLRQFPLIGDFMAYQMAIDLNYSPLFDFSENDFTVAGPGARRGIEKCFESKEEGQKIIMMMVENQDKEFERLGLKFRNLWGRKLQAIDCQGLFCETDKYCRVKFPELKSNRVKIKATYKQNSQKIDYFYPPKWGINTQVQNYLAGL